MPAMTFPHPRVSAVMQAMGLSPDYSFVDASILSSASDRGSTVHRMIEVSHRDPTNLRIPTQLRGYWSAYARFRDDTQHEPIESELEVRHPGWRYIGHVDRVGWINKTRRFIIDWKCVSSLDVEAVKIQLAAYRMAHRAMHPQITIHGCAAVQLRPDGQYRFVEVNADDAEPIWLAALTLYHARVKMGRIGPWSLGTTRL